MNVTKPSVEIIDMKDYDEMIRKIEKIGRVCYKSEGNITEESAERFIRNILKRGHESVIEHEAVTVRMICDRGITQFGNEITVIDIAGGFSYDLNNETDLQKYEAWMRAMENAEKSYFELIELGATPQEARSVLPNSLKTEIVVTMNLRSWRNFFRLRCDSHAHPQMREVANIALDLFKKRLPIFFDDIN